MHSINARFARNIQPKRNEHLAQNGRLNNLNMNKKSPAEAGLKVAYYSINMDLK